MTPTEALHPPSYVLLDFVHRDAKNRSLLEMTECRDQIWKEVLGPTEPTGGLLDGLKKTEDGEGVVRVGVF